MVAPSPGSGSVQDNTTGILMFDDQKKPVRTHAHQTQPLLQNRVLKLKIETIVLWPCVYFLTPAVNLLFFWGLFLLSNKHSFFFLRALCFGWNKITSNISSVTLDVCNKHDKSEGWKCSFSTRLCCCKWNCQNNFCWLTHLRHDIFTIFPLD